MASSSEFLLDIKARMSGPAADELSAAQKAAQDAIDRFSELERTSASTAKALERVGQQRAALEGKAQKLMDAGDTAGFWKMASAIEAVRKKEDELKAKANETKAALEAEKHAVSGLADNVASLKAANDNDKEPIDVAKTGDGLNKLGGPLGRAGTLVKDFTEGWNQLVEQVGKGPAVFAVAGVAAVALAAILATVAVKFALFALKSADAARDSKLSTEAFLAQVGAGQDLADSMDEVHRGTGVAGDRLQDITRSLIDAKVSSADMPRALRAIAQQEAALGNSNGTGELIEKLKSGKTSVGDLAKEMETKFGGIAEKRMISLSSLGSRLQENFGRLFSGLNIEPVLKGLDKLVNLFDDSTESGAALKAIVESVLQPLIDNAGPIFAKVERFFLGMISAALDVAIAVKKVAKAFDWDMGDAEGWPDIADVGKAAAYAIATAVGLVAAAIMVVVASMQVASAAWSAFVDVAMAVGDAVIAGWEAVSSFFEGVDLSSVGSDLIQGLADGITENAAAVLEALGGVVDNAISTAKSKLGIHSPSRVFYEIGDNTVAGFSNAVNDNAPTAKRSMERMVQPPKVGASNGNASSGGAPNITVNITVNGGGSDADFEERVRRAVEKGIRDALDQSGAADVDEESEAA